MPALLLLLSSPSRAASADSNVVGPVGASTNGVANLTGAGSLTAYGGILHIGAATLAGIGSISTTGTRFVLGSGTLSGSSSLSATGVASNAESNILGPIATPVTGAANLTGSGSLTASPSNIGTASLSASGSLSANGFRTVRGQFHAAGTSSIRVVGTDEKFENASLVGASSNTTDGFRTVSEGAILSGSGSLNATYRLTYTDTATLAGSGSLSVSTDVRTVVGTVAAVGIGSSIVIPGPAIMHDGVSLAGTGSLSVSSRDLIYAGADLFANSVLIANGTGVSVDVAPLVGLDLISIDGFVTRSDAAVLIGNGAIRVAPGDPTIVGVAVVSGVEEYFPGGMSPWAWAIRHKYGNASLGGQGQLLTAVGGGISYTG